MIIKPKIRGFICTTAHPAGCEAHVREQIAYVKSRGELKNGPKKVLVIGASTGYGLASRINAAFGSGAATIGVFLKSRAVRAKQVPQVGTMLLVLTKQQRKRVCMQKASTVMHFLMNAVKPLST